MDEAFKKGEDAYTAKYIEKKNNESNFLYKINVLFNDKNTEINRKVEEARRSGKSIEARENPLYAMAGLNYLDGKLKNFILDNYQPAYAKAMEVTSEDGWGLVGKLLQLERSIYERGELANP